MPAAAPSGRRHREAHRAQTARVDPRRGFSNCQNCDAHIWCWPTPDTTIVSSSPRSQSRSIAVLRLQGSVGLLVVGVRELLFHASSWPSQAFRSGRRPSSSWRVSELVRELGDHVLAVADDRHLDDPVSCRSLPGSMSTWITVAPGANASSLPGDASSNRAPRATAGRPSASR
jgi:hypothetical protein